MLILKQGFDLTAFENTGEVSWVFLAAMTGACLRGAVTHLAQSYFTACRNSNVSH